MELKIKKNKKGKINVISNPNAWRKYAPPQNPKKQWVDGRSAKTLAEYVFKNEEKDFCHTIEGVLASLNLDTPQSFKCEPEAKTPFPQSWGTRGARSHDLKMIGDTDLIICIEAKVDEPFGEKLSTKRRDAEKKNADGGKNMNLRIDSILDFIYPKGKPLNAEGLMYQLLSATAGTILEAKEKGKSNAIALFVVFKTNNKTSKNGFAINNSKYKEFCRSLGLSSDGGAIDIDGIKCWIKKVDIDFD